MKDTLLQVLGQLYEHEYNTDEYDYDTVDDFYAFLGYDLGLEHELQSIGITSTSELQQQMLSRENKI